MIVVGLTGSFASGKTTVAKMFVKRGARFLSADDLVHRLLRVRGACRQKVIRVFGKGILSRGNINRRKLAAIVFSDPLARRTLERIIHPAVIREIKEHVKKISRSRRTTVYIIEVPLLFETGLERNFDFTMTVVATRSQQIRRAQRARHLSRQEITHRIKAQLPLSVKRRLADILIDNRGPFLNTERQVSLIWKKLKTLKKDDKK